MIKHSLFLSVLCAAALASSCTSYSFGHRDAECNPDVRLAGLLEKVDRCKEGRSADNDGILVDCDRARTDIKFLALEFPNHVPTLMANAVLAYEAREPEKAMRYLDALFAIQPGHAEAGILRSRLSIDEGNLPAARELLLSQISYAPDHAGLHEALSAVLYMERDHEGAFREISAAEKLGAPAWRVAYNRGLIAEAAGQSDGAIGFYEAALQANPEFKAARSRRDALKAGVGYTGASSPPVKSGGG
jgi:tetratricopeptide (TPR) repeat protein